MSFWVVWCICGGVWGGMLLALVGRAPVLTPPDLVLGVLALVVAAVALADAALFRLASCASRPDGWKADR